MGLGLRFRVIDLEHSVQGLVGQVKDVFHEQHIERMPGMRKMFLEVEDPGFGFRVMGPRVQGTMERCL